MDWNLRRVVRNGFDQYVERRLPLQTEVTLNQSRIFILPTGQGLLLVLIAALILLLAINFESALNYALGFWLVAMLWVAVHLTYRSLSGLTIKVEAGSLVQVGDIAEVQLKLVSGQRQRGVIELIHEDWGVLDVPLYQEEALVTLPIATQTRGPVLPPRFRIESRFPFGLVVAWSNLKMDARAWAFPQPKPLQRQLASSDAQDDQATPDDHFVESGSEDFHSLKSYSPGEPIHRMYWPGFSRDQYMVKHFTDYQSGDENIEWEQFPGLSTEDRLSAIAYYAQAYFDTDQPYSVKLPGVELPVNKGRVQLEATQRMLAEFGYV